MAKRLPPPCGIANDRLQQDQAGGGIGERHAPPDGLPRQRVVIDVRIVAAQRQLEAVLAGQRAVARALSCSPSWSSPG